MSVVFSEPTIALLRQLSDQAIEIGGDRPDAEKAAFEALVSGAFHDVDRNSYDARVRRTVLFARQMLTEGVGLQHIIQRLETSCESHGVCWTMLDIDAATTINTLTEIFQLCPDAVATQFIKSGAQPGDKVVNFCSRPYLDYRPENWCSGIALMRENSLVTVVTHYRSSGF